MEEFHYIHNKLTLFLFDKEEHILQYHSKPHTEQSKKNYFILFLKKYDFTIVINPFRKTHIHR